MKLILEDMGDVGSLIVESTKGVSKYYIEGPFILTEEQNKNGRIYPKRMMEEEIERYTNDMIKTNRSLGELGHPATPALDHERASHIIESLIQDGNSYIGRARILTHLPMGKIVKGLIDENVNFGVSTRGIGGLKKTDRGTIVENYKLATAADIVSDPSYGKAFVHGILENVEWIYNITDDQFVQQKLEDTKVEIHNNYKKIDEAKAYRLFEQYIKLLTK